MQLEGVSKASQKSLKYWHTLSKIKYPDFFSKGGIILKVQSPHGKRCFSQAVLNKMFPAGPALLMFEDSLIKYCLFSLRSHMF